MAKGGRRIGAGRKRKPTELKVLEGRFDPKRDSRGPAVEPGFPKGPPRLTESERSVWEEFPRPCWITKTDRVTVHGAVSLYARILTLQELQKQQESTDTLVRLIAQEATLWGRLLSHLSALGLTPTDRLKMTAPKDEPVADKWAGTGL